MNGVLPFTIKPVFTTAGLTMAIGFTLGLFVAEHWHRPWTMALGMWASVLFDVVRYVVRLRRWKVTGDKELSVCTCDAKNYDREIRFHATTCPARELPMQVRT
jgi:hypothetical protein